MWAARMRRAVSRPRLTARIEVGRLSYSWARRAHLGGCGGGGGGDGSDPRKHGERSAVRPSSESIRMRRSPSATHDFLI